MQTTDSLRSSQRNNNSVFLHYDEVKYYEQTWKNKITLSNKPTVPDQKERHDNLCIMWKILSRIELYFSKTNEHDYVPTEVSWKIDSRFYRQGVMQNTEANTQETRVSKQLACNAPNNRGPIFSTESITSVLFLRVDRCPPEIPNNMKWHICGRKW